ncbi:MAG: NAD-dependent epimerase/dehydratase family protein [Pseudomonadota bacterium]
MTTILITGGNGNLGRLVADKLLAGGCQVVKFDVPGSESDTTLVNESIVTGDVRDIELLRNTIEQHQPRKVYHLASLLSGSSELDLQGAWEINATASFNLMHLSVEFGVEQFFFASTAATYGPVDENPMSQDYPQWPESMYGATKVAVERLGVYFKQKHRLDFRCLRFPLVVSPFAPTTAVSAFPSHAFRAATNGDGFSFPVARETGVSTLFLEDVIDSIVDYTAVNPEKLTRHAYNLHSYYLTAGMVAEELTMRFPGFQYSYDPVDSVERLISSWPDTADDRDAANDWGWSPKFDFGRSVDRMLEMLDYSATK